MDKEKKAKGPKKKEAPVKPVKQEDNPAYYQNGPIYNKRGVKSLDELFGERSSPYDQRDEESYTTYLEELDLLDLQEHAVTVSVLPKQDRNAMIKILLREFRIRTSEFFNAAVIQPSTSKPLSAEVRKILAEGR